MSSGFPPQQEYLLDHWRTTLASLITISPTAQNHFHSYITPMISDSPSLRSSICFMAACHLMVLTNNRSLEDTATRYQTDAASSLWKTIWTEKPLISLAIIMILQITDRHFLTQSGINHLGGAKAIIDRAEPRIWDCNAGRFLLSVCSYHDAVGSVVSRTAPSILALHGDVPPLEGMRPMLDLKILWGAIGRISNMCSLDRSLFNNEGADIEFVLRTIDIDPSREGNEGHTVHAYKEAAYIYLHKVWHNVGSPHPGTLRRAEDCLQHLFEVPVSSPLVSAHPWPLWWAASETIDGKLRDRVRKRVRAMYEERYMPSLERLGQDIEDAWKIKDAERASAAIDKVNWVQTILAIRQRSAGRA
ncbi:hypothetical protein F4824DRAFT_480569 [Ustulina deusta]|nr:hypothetical protein F4824DRAFT_480569 [Ustulina deusta]